MTTCLLTTFGGETESNVPHWVSRPTVEHFGTGAAPGVCGRNITLWWMNVMQEIKELWSLFLFHLCNYPPYGEIESWAAGYQRRKINRK